MWKTKVVIYFIVSFTLFSCTLKGPAVSSLQGPSVEKGVFLDVPFFSQSDYQCGPSSLSSVYTYWGKRISPEEIAKEIDSSSHKGVLTLDLYLHARAQGFTVRQTQGSAGDIKELIHRGIPVIVMVDRGIWFVQKNHFMVVVGYNSKGFIVHDGREKNRYIPFQRFEAEWGRAGNWMLVVRP